MIQFFSNKKYIFVLNVFLALICLAGIYQSAEKAGVEARMVYQNKNIVVIAEHSPLQIGDIVLKVQGLRVSDIEDIEFILDSHAVGEQVDFTIDRDGRHIEAPVTLIAINSIFYLISLFLAGAIFLCLGIFVLKSRPADDMVAVVFYWVSATVCIHIMTTFGRYTIQPFYLGYFLRLIFFLASAFTPVLFVHLSFLFPRKKWPCYQWLIKGLYWLAILFFIYISTLFLQAATGPSLKYFHQFMNTYNMGRWIFALCMVFGVVNFVHSYFRALEEPERRKLRWVMLGLGIGPMGFIFLWQLPQTLISAALVPEEVILLISAITPLTFAISIVRYHILDIDFLFNRSTVYAIILAIIVIIYSTIVAASAFFLGTFTIKASLIASAIAAVIIALLFEPARIRIQQFVDKKFFRIRYDYRLAQSEFTHKINGIFQITTLSELIVTKLDQLLLTDCIGLFLINQEGQWELSAGIYIDVLDHQIKKELINFGERSLSPLCAVSRFMEAGIAYEAADIENFKRNKTALVIPLRIQNARLSGFLILGPKKSRLPFTLEDVDLLKTITSEASFAIERIRMQEELLTQYAEAKRLDELNKLKSYFVSSVSHDLQTPLTSIKIFAELLQNRKKISDKDKFKYLDIILGESERLSRLINNVLDFSRVERGEMKYRIETVDLISIIESVLRTMKYQLQQGQFELETDYPDEIYLPADQDRLAAVLMNLISNAIKYSSEKKYLKISAWVENKQAVICVEDHGIGISEEEQSKIFDTFYRSSEKRVQSLGGAGLGLTLVRHIVEAHNGTVKVESQLGRGTKFILYLPMGDNS